MYKYIGLMMLSFLCVRQAEAACKGGSLVTSHKATDSGCSAETCNERTFCVSTNGMNWWSAMAWCKANGMQLASWDSVCPATGSGTTCQNWKDKGQVWLRNFSSSDTAWLIRPHTQYRRDSRWRNERYLDSQDIYAICEEMSAATTE